MARRLLRITPAIAMLVALAGCSEDKKDSGLHGGALEGGTTDSGGSVPPVPEAAPPAVDAHVADCGGFGRVAACTSCLKSHCCAEATDCATTPDCVSAVGCIRACDGKPVSCQQDCAAQFPRTASSIYNPLVACMFNSCSAECPFPSP